MKKALTQKFFDRATLKVAEELLGKYLVRKYRGKEIALMVTETEAYDGFKDKASQAHRGETPRNKIMFGEAGRSYVYFTYGMHWMLNITTGKKGYPAAVLIRGADVVSGPARLTKFLKIDKKLNNQILSKVTGLWMEDRGVKVSKKDILRSPRIGIPRAEEWVDKPYRFLFKQKNKRP